MIYSNNDKKILSIPSYFLKFPVRALCLMLQSLNQPTLLVVHSSIMLTTESNRSSQHYLLHFSVFKAFKLFFQNYTLTTPNHLYSNSFLAVNLAVLDLAATCGNKYKSQETIQLTKNTECLPKSYDRLFYFLV